MTKNQNPKKGFTLIELLVVIAIVALLATVAIVAMNNARVESRNTKRKADIKQIASALEVYLNNYKAYPKNCRVGAQCVAGYNQYDQTSVTPAFGFRWDSSCYSGSPADPFLTPLSSSGIMAIIPDDPNQTNADYCYLYSSTTDGNTYANKYYLMAYLEGQNGEKACAGLTSQPPASYTCVSNSH